MPLTFLQFSREYEAEADYLGIQYMYKAGYDPQGMVSIFEKLSALEKHKPGALSKAFSDHPATPDRIAAVENEIATILPAGAAVHGDELGVRHGQGAAGADPEQARAER